MALDKNKQTALINGNIYTVDSRFSKVVSVLIDGDRISLVGSNDDIKKYITNQTEIIDLFGNTLIPGFIDSHAHYLSYGNLLKEINLNKTKSSIEALNIIESVSLNYKKGDWITGRGWNHEQWSEKCFPSHLELSSITPDNPAYFRRVDGHAGWANLKAMELAHIDRFTTDPKGGKIIRDIDGNPTGIFIDNAEQLITSIIPKKSAGWKKDSAILVNNECIKLGITGVHDAETDQDTIEIFRDLYKEDRIKLRLYVMLKGLDHFRNYISKSEMRIINNNKLTIKAVKLFMDGSLGSRSASLIEPYSDDPENYGLLIMEEDELYETTLEIIKNDFQVCVHSIGDNANHLVLNAYERAIKEIGGNNRRLRIEHAQILKSDDIDRFSKNGIIPAVQPIQLISDMSWTEKRIGKNRLNGVYAFKSLIDSGAIVCSGTDFPVEEPDPLLGFYSAVTRSNFAGMPSDGWIPKEKISREQALRSYTINSAYASFEEDIKGSIEAGKLADMVLLSRDIMSIEPTEILDTKVLMTMIGGEIVYQIPNY